MFYAFTSGRDYRPAFFWGTMLPPNTVYVRVIVAAPTFDQAVQQLHERGVPLYAETLRDADPQDSQAAAILEHATRHCPYEPSAYAVIRTDEDLEGRTYAKPRIGAYELTQIGPREIGRIRVVGMGRPTDPEPVTRVVPEDGEDDPVAMPEDREGPIPPDNPVSTAVAYPAGPLGAKLREIEGRLPRQIAETRDQLNELLGDLALSRRTADPIAACDRGAGRLHDLAQKLAGLHADAHLVETILRTGN
jgi:hypothetical protein